MLDVIIITYNRLDKLRQLIDSIEKQTMLPRRVVIYDDCSTDGTDEFLKTYQGPFELIFVPGEGKSPNVAWSRNLCLEHVDSEFLIVMDDDDLMPRDKIESSIKFLSENNAGLICGQALLFDEANKLERLYCPIETERTIKLEPSFFWGKNPLNWATVSFRTSALKAVGGFDPRFAMITDWTVYLRIISQFDCFYIPKIMGYYRVHSGNMSTNTPMLIDDLEKFADDPLASRFGYYHYLMISKYYWTATQGDVLNSIKVVLAYNEKGLTLLKKILLVGLSTLRMVGVTMKLRGGGFVSIGSVDSRLLSLLKSSHKIL